MGPLDAPRRVELDAASAAPPLPAATAAWTAALGDGWADERGLHASAARSRRLLEASRSALAEVLGVRADDLALPPDHGAALRAAVLGLAAPGADPRGPVVVSAVEHSAVLHAAAWQGGEVRTVGVDGAGHVDVDLLRELVPGARLVCVQHANGEIGTAQDLAGVHEVCRTAGVPLLVDAGSSLGHLPTPTAWDALVASPRAWGSVPGVAVLATRPGTRWRAHEPGEAGASRRPGEHPGTVDVPAALAAAVSLQGLLGPGAALGADDPRHTLVARVREAAGGVPDVVVVGDPVARLPHVLTLSALYVPGEELVRGLDAAGFSVGSGSACTADTLRPSHVLAAVGALTHGNVRLGLPRGTTAEDVERFCAVLPDVVAQVRHRVGADGL